MSAVVHHQRPSSHLLCDQTCHIRIGIARRGRHTLIGIPVDLLDLIGRMVLLNECGHLVGSSHVDIIVTVVAHHADGVLPRAGILVVGIVKQFVCQHLCFFLRSGRQATYGHIRLSQIHRHTVSHLLNLFLIIEQTEEVITHITVHMTEGVLTLKTEQEVIRIIAFPLTAAHPVIPGSIA